MADNNKDGYIKIDLQAEKVALSGFTEVLNKMEEAASEANFVETRSTELSESVQTPKPAVEAMPKQTPVMATKNISNGPSANDIQQELDKLKDSINSNLLPYIDAKFNSVSDQLPSKNGDRMLEQRVTNADINFVFEERLTNITRAPIWA